MPTIVASGSLVSPGGQQGAPGPIGGGGISALLPLSGTYNLTAADSSKYAICTGGSWTLGLPAPALGMNFTVRNDMGIAAVTGMITIQPASGTIDGLSSLALLAGQEVRILTDGVNWRTFGRQRECVIGTQDLSNAAQGVILLPPGYRYYRLLFEALAPTVAAYLIAQISSDGGNTWRVVNYYSTLIYNTSLTVVQAASSAAGAGFFLTNTLVAASGNTSANVDVILWPGDGIRGAHCLINSGGFQSSTVGVADYIGHQFDNGTPVVIANALKYFMNTGNIANSLLTVKGVV